MYTEENRDDAGETTTVWWNQQTPSPVLVQELSLFPSVAA